MKSFILLVSCGVLLFVASASQEPDSLSTTTVTNTTDSDTADNNEPSTSLITSMYINTRKPALSSPMTMEVFSESSLAPSFNSCTLATPLMTTSDNNTDQQPCFLDDPYNGRLSFQLTFQADPTDVRSALISRPPEVITSESGKSIASPMLMPIPSDDDDDSNEHPNLIVITVLYNCLSNVNGIIPISLTLHFSENDDDDVIINWQKNCQNGVNDKMYYGYLTGDENEGTHTLHSFGQESTALLTVGPSDESTEFFLKLDQPGALQVFMAPYITSAFSDIVTLNIRGNHPQGGLIEGLAVTKFQIGYECHRKGEATIEANIGIPPFRNISAVWKKDCGGNYPSKLQVGTDEDGFDIVDNGEPTPKYMVGIDNLGTEHSDEHLHIPGNVSEWVFFIKNGDSQDGQELEPESDTAMLIGRITATIENPSVVFPMSPVVFLRTAMTWKKPSTPVSSYILRAGDTIKVVVPLLCRTVGKESRVLITVPVLQYKELEFGVAKECTHVGEAHKSSEFVLTVGTVFWGSVFIVLGIAVLFYIRRKNIQKGNSFSPVPLYEQSSN